MAHKRTIALDFDGVLHDYKGWNDGKLNGPYLNAREFCLALINQGCRLVVHTTRAADVVTEWLEEYGFPDIPVSNTKPIAHAYLDDRAVRFNGEWTEELLLELVWGKTYWEV